MNNNGLSKRSDVMGGQQKHFESGHNWYIIIQNKIIYLVLHSIFDPNDLYKYLFLVQYLFPKHLFVM